MMAYPLTPLPRDQEDWKPALLACLSRRQSARQSGSTGWLRRDSVNDRRRLKKNIVRVVRSRRRPANLVHPTVLTPVIYLGPLVVRLVTGHRVFPGSMRGQVGIARGVCARGRRSYPAPRNSQDFPIHRPELRAAWLCRSGIEAGQEESYASSRLYFNRTPGCDRHYRRSHRLAAPCRTGRA